MRRYCLACLGALVFLTCAQGGTSPDVKTTIAYLRNLQTTGGGFLLHRPAKGKLVTPSLRATSAAIRALHYMGGEVPDKQACVTFVRSCFHKESGGFANLPGGKPDVFSTAVGLMAVVALRMPREPYEAGAVNYLAENSKTFKDIRIAVAGLEAVQKPSPKARAWLEQIAKMRNPDGTYGKELAHARATGGAVVAVLRLGGKVDQRDQVLKVLKEGQRTNGGYGKDDSELASDLETTYRVMRAFVMLKELPADVEGVRSFVLKCRNKDGGFAVSPGEASTAAGTYYAAIIRHWLEKK
jgi:prenyltransferase beta subunit